MQLLTRPTVRITAATATALACALVPVFLFGALSELVRADLTFDEAGVGAGVTVFFAAAGVSAVPGGKVTERVGPRVAMLVGTTLAGVASLGIGVLAQQWWHAAVLLGVAGSAVGLIDTGGARAFADAVPARRQGLAFGVKEASVPAASMVAGLAVPVLGLTVGWRATFGLGLLLVPVVWLVLPSQVAAAQRARPIDHHVRPARATLLLIALGSAVAGGVATATASFLVPAATAAGVSTGLAGALLAAGSLASIAARVSVGRLADRRPGQDLSVTAALMVVGTLGLLLLATDLPAAVAAGGLVTLGAGWGWTGLVFLSAVRADPSAPAAAAGIVLAGLSIGGALGPAVVGVAVARVGYGATWMVAAAAMALGAIAVFVAARTRRA